MTKETQTHAIAEPFKFKNAALLNRLSEMAQVPYYATACHTLIQAEMAIVELERENATLRAEVERLVAQSAPTEPPLSDCGQLMEAIKGTAALLFGQGAAQQYPFELWRLLESYIDQMTSIVNAAARGAQSAPLQQAAREYPPLPEGKAAIRCVADTDEGGWVVDFD